jgi:hypothetical protein
LYSYLICHAYYLPCLSQLPSFGRPGTIWRRVLFSEASQISLIYEEHCLLVCDVLVVWQQFIDVSEVVSASILGVGIKPNKQKARRKEQDYFVRNVGKHLPDYIESHPKSYYFSLSLMSETTHKTQRLKL